MKTTKHILALFLSLALIMGLAACSNAPSQGSSTSGSSSVSDSGSSSASGSDKDEPVKIRVGTFAGTEPSCRFVTDILESRYGYEIDIQIFEGNTMPATALKDGDLDMVLGNSLTWMKTFCEQNSCDFTMLEPYYYYTAIGLYSVKHDSLDAIPQDAQIVIPSDSTNMNKALKLLEEAGLITLGEPSAGAFVTTLDIIENPRNIQIVEGDITSSARSIEDVDAVIATSSVALDSGKIDPASYLFRDSNPTPIGFFTRTEDSTTEWAKQAAAIIESGEINDIFNQTLQGRYFLVTEWN